MNISSVTFYTSLSKRNYVKERKILVDGGLLLDCQDNEWIRMNVFGTSQFTSAVITLERKFEISRKHHPVILLTARQMVSMHALLTINPNLNPWDLLHTIKLTERNAMFLAYSLGITHSAVNGIRQLYPTLNFCN